MKIRQGRPPNIEFTENYLAQFFGFLTTFLGFFLNPREIIRISATEIFQYLIMIIFEYRNNNEISKL